MKQLRPIDITLGGLFVCLMAIGANITVWFPILIIPIGGAAVPLSLQTFFAIICGFILGKKRAALTMLTYILIGVCGVPLFAKMLGGPMALVQPTGGFIISFIFVGYVTGWFAERKTSHANQLYLTAAFTGLCINYIFGVTYMYIMMNTWMNLNIPYDVLWSGMIPFLVKDSVLSFLAVMFTMQIQKRIPNQLRVPNL